MRSEGAGFSRLPESMVSNRSWNLDHFGNSILLTRFLQVCPKVYRIFRVQPVGYALDGKIERYRTVWVGRTIPVISPSFVSSATEPTLYFKP